MLDSCSSGDGPRGGSGSRAAGCPKLNLQVRASNRQAVAFYERLGYAVEDRVSMGKLLAGGETPASTQDT